MRSFNPYEAQRTGRAARGFSLIELLIVVAIILIISAIAIPNLVRARMSANQSSAVESCRTITSAEVIYYTQYGNGFAPSLTALGGPVGGSATPLNAQLIDDVLSAGTKSGYIFTYSALNADPTGAFQDYALNADPLVIGVTGENHYFTDEPSVIHMNTSAPASVTDPPIQ
jgi:type IV pilus assembly protein PilA